VQLAFAIYPGFTVLDIVGPFQVLSAGPDTTAVFVAPTRGWVPDGTGICPLFATATFDEVPAPDVVVVSGGDVSTLDPRLTEWIRRVHETTTWTTSVCTGSNYLGAAGLLDGLDATTHWGGPAQLERFGARYTAERVVERGKIITAAGVSSGIDMALRLLAHLHGPTVAQAVQLAIEYDPQPPFDAGSPAKAPAAVRAYLEALYRSRQA
jgi:transcriptional regulator GlxA family with amidase domain